MVVMIMWRMEKGRNEWETEEEKRKAKEKNDEPKEEFLSFFTLSFVVAVL